MTEDSVPPSLIPAPTTLDAELDLPQLYADFCDNEEKIGWQLGAIIRRAYYAERELEKLKAEKQQPKLPQE